MMQDMILRTLAITWPQVVMGQADRLAVVAQVHGDVMRPTAFSLVFLTYRHFLRVIQFVHLVINYYDFLHRPPHFSRRGIN